MTITKFPEVRYEEIVLRGGLDQITPTLSAPPGILKDTLNYECSVLGGYSRCGGYERLDGRPAPSSANFSIIPITTFVNTPTIGQTITNQTATPTAIIIALSSTYVGVTKVTGSFVIGDTIKVGATTIGTYGATQPALSSLVQAQYTALAADNYRADIGQVPGSGPVRGAVIFNGVSYAFRDNGGATATVMYKATTTGWSAISLGYELSFTSTASTIPAIGQTLTGATSGKSGVIAAIVQQTTNAWGAVGSKGIFILTGATGVFTTGENLQVGGVTKAVSGTDQFGVQRLGVQISLLTGGKFEFSSGNFSGQAGTIKLYWADGKNRICEFDGTTVIPISTGSTPDTPKHLAVHKNYLIFSIGSSIFYSGVGQPYLFTGTGGAGEIATGDSVTNLLIMPGDQSTGALAVFCSNNTFVLYGTGSTTWNLVSYNTGTGALDYTAQNMEDAYFLGNRGVATLKTTIQYGNFTQSMLTNQVKTFIEQERPRASASCVSRYKSQYRVFFSDGYALFITIIEGKLVGCMPQYFSDPLFNAWTGSDANGNEATLFCAQSSGYVYKGDIGTSFDGQSIESHFSLNWDSIKSPRILKRFRRASLEISGTAYAAINFGWNLGYGSTEIVQGGSDQYTTPFTGVPMWDSFTWDNFVWDGQTLAPTECELQGTGENIQLMVASSSNYIAPYTINSVIIHYTPRRGLR